MSAVRLGVCALLFLAPLPFGSVEPWAVLALELGALTLGAAAVHRHLRDGEPIPRRSLAPFGVLAALVLVGILQALPLGFGPCGGALRLPVGPLGENPALSVAPPETVDATLRLAAYAAAALATALSFRSSEDRRLIANTLLLSCVFQAVYGSAEYLSGSQRIFGYTKRFYLDAATGTFINRNHFAEYLALCLPFAMAALVAPRDPRRPGFAGSLTLSRFLGGAALLTGSMGILLSFSRAGLAMGLIAVTVGAALATRRRRTLAIAAAAVALPLAVLLLWQDARTPGERVLDSIAEGRRADSRLAVWSAAAELASRCPWTGTGLGTFASVFPLVQPAEASGSWSHAHNDWLELPLEAGIPGTLAAAAVGVALWRRKSKPSSDAPAPYARAAALALGIAALHAVVDFGLRIPALATTVAVIAALALSNGPPAERVLEFKRPADAP